MLFSSANDGKRFLPVHTSAFMATLEESKKLLETELGPIRIDLESIEKNFTDLKTSVDYLSATYDEVFSQLGHQ